MGRKFISWRRVSTKKQGGSGLGLDAQKEIIRYFIERENGEWIADYEECFTGTDLNGCVELQRAIDHAQKENAVLIIAKTDRCRNTIEALQLYDRMGDGNVMFCDLPHTDKFSLTLFFALAEREALLVSIRTKQALAAKRQRGEVTGGASERWRMAFINKSKEQKEKESMKRGATKNRRWLESRNVVAFRKVIRSVFPDATNGTDDILQWNLKAVNTKGDNKVKMLSMMRDYRELDPSLFKDWDFTQDFEGVALQVKLATFINSLRRAVNCTKARQSDAEDERIVEQLMAEDAACEC